MNLTNELLKSLKDDPKKKRGNGKNAFLRNKSEIAEALSEGFSAKHIWEHLKNKGEMPISYRVFMYHIEKYLQVENTQQKSTFQSTKEDIKVEINKPTSEAGSDWSILGLTSSDHRLINDLEDAELTPDDVKNWNVGRNMIRQRLTSYLSKKQRG